MTTLIVHVCKEPGLFGRVLHVLQLTASLHGRTKEPGLNTPLSTQDSLHFYPYTWKARCKD